MLLPSMSSDNDWGSMGGAPREAPPPSRKRSKPSSDSNPITPRLSSLEDVQFLLKGLKRNPNQTLSEICQGRMRILNLFYTPERIEPANTRREAGGEDDEEEERNIREPFSPPFAIFVMKNLIFRLIRQSDARERFFC